MKNSAPDSIPSYERAMGREGLRLTPQRRHVYEVLMAKRDHPTATEVFIRAQKRMPSISLATVYNCLETRARTLPLHGVRPCLRYRIFRNP
jgi:Fur family peroxide stress response transcriptional regulator